MRNATMQLLKKFACGTSGQSAVVIAVIMTAVTALTGSSVEAGHVYYAYQKLVQSTQAATLAGAQAMPDTKAAASNVTTYSSVAGQMNATWSLQNAKVTPTFQCLKTVQSMNIGCDASGYNALQVTQTAQVPLWFGGVIGIPKFNLSASATAAMRGGSNNAWNIALIIDTTGSMNNYDGKQCNGTKIKCAIQGAQTLLGKLTPCPTGDTCSGTGVPPVDSVSLYVFPPVLASTAKLDYCSGGKGTPTHEYYRVPDLPTSPAWTYQIVPYSNDYQVVGGSGTLNSASNLVLAVGGVSATCPGLQAPGGAGTYYAQVIYQAESDLEARSKNSNDKNAIIILSDGDAAATYSGGSGSQLQASTAGSLNGITGNNPTTFTYPSAVGECGQAVVAAQAATAAGTTVFTIGYGASNTTGCSSDQKYSVSTPASAGGGAWAPGYSPCKALAAMASDDTDFYSDDSNGCAATAPSNASITSLVTAFKLITSQFGVARLIPNGSN